MDSEFSNNHCGITVEYGVGDGSDRGTAFEEEYFYHDKLTSDRKVVYIKSTTPIRMLHNEFNTLPILNGKFHPQIGANGIDGIADSGDEGVIRYRVDRETQIGAFEWTNYSATPAFPAYSAPFTFGDLEYTPGTSVVGTTGRFGTEGDVVNSYWRGMLDSVGDEWHQITVGDDDTLVLPSQKAEQTASDGRNFLFVVNPKTPCLKMAVTGDAQFYTTPPKTLTRVQIHEQTTYFTAGASDTFSLTITDINGNNVFYRIGGGAFTDAGAATVTLTKDDFSDGSNTLEYYYAGNAAYTKTRTVVKNPTHPSLAETHGLTLWPDQEEKDKAFARLTRTPYSGGYSYMKSNANFHGRDKWKLWGRTGHATWWHTTSTAPYGRSSAFTRNPAFANAIISQAEGLWNTTVSGDTLTYGEYVKEMVLGQLWARAEPIGIETTVSSGPNPSTQLNGPGYSYGYETLDAAIAYDLMAAHYRSDQFAGGMTPIEDYFIRDTLWSYATYYLGSLSRGLATPGLWTPPRITGALFIAACLSEYSTPYYGTSGYGTVQTVYPSIPELAYTFKLYMSYSPGTNPTVPGPNVATFNYDEPALFTAPGYWTYNNSGYFNLLSKWIGTHSYLMAIYNPTVTYPLMEQSMQFSTDTLMKVNGGATDYTGQEIAGVKYPKFHAFPQVGNEQGGALGLDIVATLKAASLESSVISSGGGIDLYSMMIYDDGYGFETAQPECDYEPGEYEAPINLTFTTVTPSSTIYYTDDGSEPTELSTVYSAPIALGSYDTTTTIKAIAKGVGLDASPVYSGTFRITQNGQPAAPRNLNLTVE